MRSSRTRHTQANSTPLDALLPGHGRSFRHLQQPPPPLQIQFTTTIQFPSEENNGWDADELVASAFASPEQQSTYVTALQEVTAAGASYFTSLDRVSFEVEGKLITEGGEVETVRSPDKVDDSLANSNAIDANLSNTDSSSTTMYYIVAAVVAGACIFIFAITTVIFFLTRRNSESKNARSSSSTNNKKQDSSLPPVKITNSKGLDGLEIKTDKSDTLLINQPTSYIGTIESKEGEGDDISTLGDPYMGDAVNAVMDMDNTVGESMVSSQHELYVHGVGRPQGASIVGGGTIGGSTMHSGSKLHIFGDDPTLEDMYRSPRCSDVMGRDDGFELKTVMAPAGKLGIVLDNPHGDLPVVWAIKETSVLHGGVRVGDLLLSVDGVDCRGMSTHRVSMFLSSRSMNMNRTLVFARGSDIVNEVQRAALW